MAAAHSMCDSANRLAGHHGSGQPGQCPGGPDEQRVRGTHDLYAQAEAARKQSQAVRAHRCPRCVCGRWPVPAPPGLSRALGVGAGKIG